MHHFDSALYSPAGLTIRRYDFTRWESVRKTWVDLTNASPYTTFFISPEWVDAWLRVFGLLLNPEILVFVNDQQHPVGACILVRRHLRRGPFLIRRIFLNTAGENEGEGPVVEFNDLLCLAGEEEAVCTSIRRYIDGEPWDEFWVNGFREGRPLETLREAFSHEEEQRTTLTNYYVDLVSIRNQGRTYESILGAKDRARLRQNLRDYGKTQVYAPSTVSSAMDVLDQLIRLHTDTWKQRNQQGAFVSPVFRAFHESLIRGSFEGKHIQIVRVDATAGTIGVLYNMVYRGNVYFYQSGFSYSSNKRIRPGFVAITRTILHCLEQPELRAFHLMAGGDHYKAPLSTDRQLLEWIVFRKRSCKNSVIKWLRRNKARFGSSQTTKTVEAPTD